MSKAILKTLKIVIIVIAVLLFIIAAVFFWLDSTLHKWNSEVFSRSKFDREIWVATQKAYNPLLGGSTGEDYACICGQIYDDLIKNHLKKGVNLDVVRKLLGISTYKRIYPDKGSFKECLEYYLGSCYGWGGGTRYLEVCFGKDNKLYDIFMVGHELNGAEFEKNKDGVKIYGK